MRTSCNQCDRTKRSRAEAAPSVSSKIKNQCRDCHAPPVCCPRATENSYPWRVPNEQCNRRDVPIGGYQSPPVELNSPARPLQRGDSADPSLLLRLDLSAAYLEIHSRICRRSSRGARIHCLLHGLNRREPVSASRSAEKSPRQQPKGTDLVGQQRHPAEIMVRPPYTDWPCCRPRPYEPAPGKAVDVELEPAFKCGALEWSRHFD